MSTENAIAAILAGMTQGFKEGLQERQKRKVDEQELALKRDELDARTLDRMESRKQRLALAGRDQELRESMIKVQRDKVTKDVGDDYADTTINAAKAITTLTDLKSEKASALADLESMTPERRAKRQPEYDALTKDISEIDSNLERLKAVADRAPRKATTTAPGKVPTKSTTAPPADDPAATLKSLSTAATKEDLKRLVAEAKVKHGLKPGTPTYEAFKKAANKRASEL